MGTTSRGPLNITQNDAIYPPQCGFTMFPPHDAPSMCTSFCLQFYRYFLPFYHSLKPKNVRGFEPSSRPLQFLAAVSRRILMRPIHSSRVSICFPFRGPSYFLVPFKTLQIPQKCIECLNANRSLSLPLEYSSGLCFLFVNPQSNF